MLRFRKIMIYNYTLPVILLLVSFQIYPQQHSADSLTNKLKYLSGEEKVDVLGELADIYQYINNDSAMYYAEKGIALALEINYKKGLAFCYGSLGFCFINYDANKAIEFTKRALDIRTSINDQPGIAASLNVLGVIYYYKGDYLKSIEYHLKALQLREKIGNELRTATSYNNISLVYMALEDYETALNYLNKALEIRTRTNNKTSIGIIKDNMGFIYSKKGEFEKAFRYLNEALLLNEEMGNNKTIASNHFNLAGIYKTLVDYEKAFYHLSIALKIYNALDEKHGIANTENSIAFIYMQQGKTDEAIKHALIALHSSKDVHSLDNIVKATEILQNAYYDKKDYENAYKYLSVFKSSSDSLKVTDKIKKLARLEFDNRVEKINSEQEAKLNRQNNLIILLSGSLFLALIIASLIIRGYANKRKLNLKLNHLNQKLKEINYTKDRFFSIIAHDLRGPFHGMLAYSELLASDLDKLSKEEVKEYSEDLNKSIQKQYELLNDLLSWARLQNDNFKINPEVINLQKEICEVINPMSFMISKKNIKVAYNVDENFTVQADKNMLRLVLRNLISNGIKFTGQNGFIGISANKKDDYDEIIISDNGMGMSQEDINKLFRIDVSHSTKGTEGESGTGIGLILCKEIIEKHSGKIEVQSEEGKGSTFSFTLKKN